MRVVQGGKFDDLGPGFPQQPQVVFVDEAEGFVTGDGDSCPGHPSLDGPAR